ncbi:uncharacterized protein PAC_16308 [Phialocephala subalpina]|uniref:Uncharacterized protein n=1 Tax=Phialocephala subalpina TaxID=576137 RepID=A0A1L7XN87_9HELO|nr:uncharacterized protein PAC_16308 [Phialocephala subalpina]
MNMPMSTTSATKPKFTTPAPTKPPSANLVRVELEKKDFTVPDYLTAWYFYGRLDPGCSCIITSAGASIVISETTTMTSYKVTKSTTVTETYTIYP